jgi:hypothetical protein
MNPSVALCRIDIRPLLTLSVVVLGLVAILPAAPAHAFESRAFGDVTIEPERRRARFSPRLGT